MGILDKHRFRQLACGAAAWIMTTSFSLVAAQSPVPAFDQRQSALPSSRVTASSPASLPNNYCVTPQPIQLVPAGTVVQNSPPSGWSHLIMKSVPRCMHGDVNDVSGRDIRLAEMFTTVLLANVAKEQGTAPKIANLAIGWTSKIQGQDTVVSPSTAKQLGAKLGLLGPIILKEIHKRREKIIISVYSSRFAIVDLPAAVHYENRNRQMTMRHAFVLDDQGRLTTLLWLLMPQANGFQLLSKIHPLPPDHLQDAQMYVDKQEYSFGMPSDNAFAIVSIPQANYQIPPPRELIPLMIPSAYSAAQAATLDRQLRSLLISTSDSRSVR